MIFAELERVTKGESLNNIESRRKELKREREMVTHFYLITVVGLLAKRSKENGHE